MMFERMTVGRAVDSEVPAVESKHCVDALSLGDIHQGGIGHLRLSGGVVIHKRNDPEQRYLIEFDKLDQSAFDQLTDGFHPARVSLENPSGFGQDWPTGE